MGQTGGVIYLEKTFAHDCLAAVHEAIQRECVIGIGAGLHDVERSLGSSIQSHVPAHVMQAQCEVAKIAAVCHDLCEAQHSCAALIHLKIMQDLHIMCGSASRNMIWDIYLRAQHGTAKDMLDDCDVAKTIMSDTAA